MLRFSKAIAVLMLMVVMGFIAGCKPQENNNVAVRVTTLDPQYITQTSAVCGGEVTVEQGSSVDALGVCWGTEPNPIATDDLFSTSNWDEPYVCTITGLVPGTEYHVRAYALRDYKYYYGEDKKFTTEKPSSGGGEGSLNGYAYVDLALPSGTLWATCNVGADTPEGYGDYFSWGETTPKTIYNWDTYKYCNGDYDQLTKYCDKPDYGYGGFTDNLSVLLAEDDAATANWGNGWCMPTYDQWVELYQYTTVRATTQNGVKGCVFTSWDGYSLFLPAAGERWNDEPNNEGSYGYYWSNMLEGNSPNYVSIFNFVSGNYNMNYDRRSSGHTVRPVCSTGQN